MIKLTGKYLFRNLFFVLSLALSSVPVATSAQVSDGDLELAEYYYNQGLYEQARLYYDIIYKTNKTNRVYTNYLNTLIALGDFEESEKLVKKKLKTESGDGIPYVNLGELYKKFDKPAEAKEQFDAALKNYIPGRNNSIRLANEFVRINEYQYALATYERARAEGADGYSYSFEIANTQGLMGNYADMIDSFLDLIIESPNYLVTVQNSLNRTLNIGENPENLDLLKNQLLKRTQKYPDEPTYNEMLVWLFLQKKDFNSAYTQAIALDKRLGENGLRIINLAELAAGNKDYSVARKAYQYVIEKGPLNEYYITANIEKLRASMHELDAKPGQDSLAFITLKNEYSLALENIGRNAETAGMMKDLAHLQAFHLGDAESASLLLEETIALPGLYDRTLAMCKLELGDIYLLKGEIWEASLLYSQVELDFKEDVMGHDAKYRNAKISYYTGDFTWAQAQLDVLKASTSKLISNDAIDLSLLITDNFNMDTITAPMEMYARADLLAFQNRHVEAVVTLDSISTLWPYHTLMDEIMMMKAGIFQDKGNYAEAIALYEKVLLLHFKDITADDALFKLAEIHQYVYNDVAKAMELYEKLLTEYPGSLYVVEARKRFRELRGDQLN